MATPQKLRYQTVPHDYENRYRLQAKQGNYQFAIANFKTAIRLKPEQPDWVFIGLGEALKKN